MKVASSMWSPLDLWRQVEVVDHRRYGYVGYLRAIVAAAARADAVILNGATGWSARYRDIVACLLIKLLARRTQVILADCTWEHGSKALQTRFPLLARFTNLISSAMITAIDSERLTYCVLSSAERESFGRRWNVDPERVVFTPFCVTLNERDLQHRSGDEGYVFAGGNSLRRYDELVEAFHSIEGLRLIVRASASFDQCPANVLSGAVPHDQYVQELACASYVAVPLAESERSAGQQTYLNAMALGKLVFVTESLGVRDYVQHLETGIVLRNTVDDWAEWLTWATGPQNAAKVSEIRKAGQSEASRRFSAAEYRTTLLSVAATAMKRELSRSTRLSI